MISIHKKNIVFFFVMALVAFFGCTKATSKENDYNTDAMAKGYLWTNTDGSCLDYPSLNGGVNGVYSVGKTLKQDSNYIKISLNVLTVGRYRVSTDTVNGIYFIDSGRVDGLGARSVKLKGYGKPTVLPAFFKIKFSGLACNCSVYKNG